MPKCDVIRAIATRLVFGLAVGDRALEFHPPSANDGKLHPDNGSATIVNKGWDQ